MSNPMRILVCGGRNFQDYNKFEKVLDYFSDITGLCHGGARGADMLTHRYMLENFQKVGSHIHGEPWDIEYKIFPANWERDGKAAGFIRNKEMFDSFKPDLVIAFPGGKGTSHMIQYSKSKSCSVLEVV